ncbi:MAG: hypothetical protein AAF228_13690 [Pseudomonadota bacterium]
MQTNLIKADEIIRIFDRENAALKAKVKELEETVADSLEAFSKIENSYKTTGQCLLKLAEENAQIESLQSEIERLKEPDHYLLLGNELM